MCILVCSVKLSVFSCHDINAHTTKDVGGLKRFIKQRIAKGFRSQIRHIREDLFNKIADKGLMELEPDEGVAYPL